MFDDLDAFGWPEIGEPTDEAGFTAYDSGLTGSDERTDLLPTVFLPGLLCDGALWRHQIDALADHVAPFVADLTLDDSIAAMARRVLASAPPRFALVALSMGGYVALEIMRQAPGRVTRLALIDTSARPDTAARAATRRQGLASLARGRFVGITRALLETLVHPDRTTGPVADTLRAMAARVGKRAYVRQQTAILNRIDSRPHLRAIRVPTLVAVGDGDRVTPPADAEEMAASIPNARLHIFRDCGHMPAVELPEETAALLLSWLAE
ncbi:alpha/beta fold hydrolase [Sphingomonas naphthae]|uniref:Alpha/beta fold hydrolase n=1 Tax=Sphingomonas naphthae TaxID=1813468 RepID=A0ABY7TRF8_9SPHN|nr:alpha/beta fold hydrolase [Sphingomonas naphthae]WCT74409.1 alpha/beta fold hydrolase [Sphingomonas naphthae]